MNDKAPSATPPAPVSGENRRLSSRTGIVIVVAVALAALAVVAAYEMMKSDLAKAMDRYDSLRVAGKRDEASKVMEEVIGAGMQLYQEQRVDEAQRAFEWADSREPKKPLVLSYLGLIAKYHRNTDKAVEYFRKATEVDPLSPMHFYNLALIDFDRKDYAACEAQLQDAIRLSPVKCQYRWLYAVCAIEGKLPADAVRSRLHDVVAAAVLQATAVGEQDLTSAGKGSLSWVCREAARRLSAMDDDFGWQELRKLAADAKKKPEVRDFAKRLLAEHDKKS